jgi:hypothetical protein
MSAIVFGSAEAQAIVKKDQVYRRAEEQAKEREQLIAEGRLYRVRTVETVCYFKVYEVEARDAHEARMNCQNGAEIDSWEEEEDDEEVCHDGVEVVTERNKEWHRR